MQTSNAQNQEQDKKEGFLPYVVTWLSAVGLFTLLLWVGVWLVKQ